MSSLASSSFASNQHVEPWRHNPDFIQDRAQRRLDPTIPSNSVEHRSYPESTNSASSIRDPNRD